LQLMGQSRAFKDENNAKNHPIGIMKKLIIAT
jgi:hypothetical protein